MFNDDSIKLFNNSFLKRLWKIYNISSFVFESFIDQKITRNDQSVQFSKYYCIIKNHKIVVFEFHFLTFQTVYYPFHSKQPARQSRYWKFAEIKASLHVDVWMPTQMRQWKANRLNSIDGKNLNHKRFSKKNNISI